MEDNFETEWIKSVTVIRLLNSDMFEFEKIGRLGELFEQFFTDCHTYRTLINFNQIEFWNSLSLGFIASLPKKAERHGCDVSLCNLNPKSMWAIQASRLHTIFDIFFDEEQALAELLEE